jgi:YfiH family protein
MTQLILPQPGGDFEWVQATWGTALRCRALAGIAPHCFSTRELSLQGRRDEDDISWNELGRELGVRTADVVRMRQVHCADVYVASRVVDDAEWPEADIAIGGDPSVALSVRVADCVPVLLADRQGPAVAAVHAGWKGTAAGAVMVAVRALTSRFNTRPEDVVAAIGPSIGACCYEVGPDVAAHFSAHPEASTWFSDAPRPHLDLWRANRDQLLRAGVPAAQIHVSALCTFDHPALFHSYRRDGNQAGRLVAAIRSAPGMTP